MSVHSQEALASRPKSQQHSNKANRSRIHGIPLPEDLPFNWLAGCLDELSLTGASAH
ncbi:GM24825 [Drosophila sechellia]|uniref:GM24825 n=1 Tax=Drosophila sechellia TaxID=7238 RepID=B4HLS7_DROSE|nr:GM24825 [Drosophila sechellia]